MKFALDTALPPVWIFKLSASAAASEFCELVHVGVKVKVNFISDKKNSAMIKKTFK